MTMLARAFAPKAVKAIDQVASGIQPGGYYVRLDDRSTFTSGFMDAQTSSLAMSTVYACVRVLAEDIAKLPFVLYRKLPSGGKERAIDHPLYPVLHDQPNPDMTSFVWRELMMSHLATWGNHYSEKVYTPSGRLQLWPIRPDRMEVTYDPKGRKKYTYLSPAGTKREMRPGSVFHVAGLSSNGLVGLSPIALHAKTLRLAETAQEFGNNFLANGARPAVVLSHPKTMSAPAIARLATQMDELRGSKNAGKTVVLEEGLTIDEIGVPPEDAQYIETRKFQRNIIATEIFRMKPHKVGDLEHATFSNIEHESLDHVIDTLMPWSARIEQEVQVQLIEESDITAELLFDGLLRGDHKSRAEALAIRWQHGTLSPDEWRALENENPLPDGIGQRTYVPVNYAPAAQPAAEIEEEEVVEPPRLTVVKSSSEVRCDKGHLLAELATPPYRFTCRLCKTTKSAEVEEPPPPPVVVQEPPVVNVAAPIINFHEGSIKGGDITVQPATIERGAVEVNVTSPPVKAPVVNVDIPPTKAIRRDVERDDKGRITAVRETVEA